MMPLADALKGLCGDSSAVLKVKWHETVIPVDSNFFVMKYAMDLFL